MINTKITYPEIFGGIKYQVGPNRKAKRFLDWSQKISLKEDVPLTIDWLKEVEA